MAPFMSNMDDFEPVVKAVAAWKIHCDFALSWPSRVRMLETPIEILPRAEQ
jgi:hypothetical protein